MDGVVKGIKLTKRQAVATTFCVVLMSVSTVGNAEEARNVRPANVNQTALQLGTAREHFFAEDYDAARTEFNLLLENGDRLAEQVLLETHRYLSALDFLDGDDEAALSHVEAAIALDEEVEPPEGSSSGLVELYEDARGGSTAESTPESETHTQDLTEPNAEIEPESETHSDVETGGEEQTEHRQHRERPSRSSTEAEGFDPVWVSLAPKIGVSVATIFNEMPPNVMAELEAGFLLPFWGHRLSLVVAGAYSPPGRREESSHQDLGDDGGEWTFEMRTHQLLLSFGMVLRVFPPGSRPVVPYAGVFGRLFFMRTNVTGETAGMDFGENYESSMSAGFSAVLGGEIKLGMGGLLVESTIGWSRLTHEITGETNAGAIAFTLGYRVFL